MKKQQQETVSFPFFTPCLQGLRELSLVKYVDSRANITVLRLMMDYDSRSCALQPEVINLKRAILHDAVRVYVTYVAERANMTHFSMRRTNRQVSVSQFHYALLFISLRQTKREVSIQYHLLLLYKWMWVLFTDTFIVQMEVNVFHGYFHCTNGGVDVFTNDFIVQMAVDVFTDDFIVQMEVHVSTDDFIVQMEVHVFTDDIVQMEVDIFHGYLQCTDGGGCFSRMISLYRWRWMDARAT